MQSQQQERRKLDIERHIQTIMVSLLTGAAMFSASYFFTDKADKAMTRVQLENLVNQVNELRTDIRDMRQSFVRRDEFTDHEARLRKLEQVKHDGR